jgi:hypothetical protein
MNTLPSEMPRGQGLQYSNDKCSMISCLVDDCKTISDNRSFKPSQNYYAQTSDQGIVAGEVVFEMYPSLNQYQKTTSVRSCLNSISITNFVENQTYERHNELRNMIRLVGVAASDSGPNGVSVVVNGVTGLLNTGSEVIKPGDEIYVSFPTASRGSQSSNTKRLRTQDKRKVLSTEPARVLFKTDFPVRNILQTLQKPNISIMLQKLNEYSNGDGQLSSDKALELKTNYKMLLDLSSFTGSQMNGLYLGKALNFGTPNNYFNVMVCPPVNTWSSLNKITQ